MKKGLIAALAAIAGAAAAAAAIGKITKKILNKEQQMSDKHLALFLMMNQWVKVKQQGKNLSTYFEKMDIQRLQYMA